ncbi:MAG: MgtC/SapB family protein [Candidatus Azobacteroides sp.]|nr:MgtC/SapB family protein [Candidatus Azobacteroides sp.]
MTIWEYTLRLSFAFLMGALIGLERQYKQKSAGLCTNILVSAGSAAFLLLSASLTTSNGDPSRVASQIVTGVGFLGGGLILKDGMSVRGLNTAATIWCSAAVGALAGLGLYMQSLLLVAMVIIAHCFFRPLGNIISKNTYLKKGSENYFYIFEIRCKEQIENHLRVMILNAIGTDPHIQLRSLKSTDDDVPTFCLISAMIYSYGKHDSLIEKLAARLTIEYGVTQVKWEINEEMEE